MRGSPSPLSGRTRRSPPRAVRRYTPFPSSTSPAATAFLPYLFLLKIPTAFSASFGETAMIIFPSFPIVSGSRPRIPVKPCTISETGISSSSSSIRTDEDTANSFATVASPPRVISRTVWTDIFPSSSSSTM